MNTKIYQSTIFALIFLLQSCSSVQNASQPIGNATASVMVASGNFPGGFIVGLAIAPLLYAGEALYRISGGKGNYPDGF